MSGLEVAGLLVGLLPLVITALEHYQDIHRARGLGARFESEYRRTLRVVKHEQLVLHLTLSDLLAPLCGDDQFEDGDLEKWLSDPDTSEWSVEEVKSIMQERLGSDFVYDHFLEITHALHQTTSKLLVTLIDKKPKLQAKLLAELSATTATPPRAKARLSVTAFQTFAKDQMAYRKEQLVHGLSKAQREDLIAQMRGDNQKLRALLEQSEKVATLRTSKASTVHSKVLKAMLQYWRHADRIYTLVSQAWECACQKKHHAHLWLRHRESAMFEISFLLLWDPGIHPKHSLQPWDCQGLRITQCRAEDVGCGPGTSKPPPNMPLATNRLKQNSASKIFQKKSVSKVHFSLGTASPKVNVAATVATEHQGDIQSVQQAALTPISKLCDSMSKCDMRDEPLGLLKDADAAYSVQTDTSQKVATECVGLCDILVGMRRSRPSRAVRFGIALAVASAHLQLNLTSWVRKQWQARDILFPRDAGSDAVMLDRPYVSTDFDSPTPLSVSPTPQTDRSFASLGIMLMELAFGLTLEEHELWQKAAFGGNEDIPLYRMMVAKVWADTLEGEVGPGYSEAVAWCLNESPMTLNGDSWRKDLATRVVLPLQESCDHIGARKYIGARS